MIEIRIHNQNNEQTFKGIYEFLEGGFEKDGKPSFHIDAHSPNFSDQISIYFYCSEMEDVEKFVEALKEQILKAKEYEN